MDPKPSYNDLPWELIMQALQGELSPEEDLRLQEWLAASESNRAKYEQLLRVWEDGMEDYAMYEQASEGQAWEALRSRMGDNAPAQPGQPVQSDREEARVIDGSFHKRRVSIKRWTVAAAVLLLAAGAGWWYMAGKTAAIQYATAAGEQKTVSLPDGSTMVLLAQTRVRLEPGYNQTGRTVALVSGSARFDVSHKAQQPFTVDMGDVSVRDIGTSFTIERTTDSISVKVSEGKVAFTRVQTGETQELSAGSSTCFYTAGHRFGEIRTMDRTGSDADSLRFDNAPLSDVITALQKATGKKIVLNDTSMAAQRLTVHLGGESFDNALKTICASLHLEYTVTDGEYILKSKDAGAHN
jgi:transmembrane sensor